MDVATGTHYAVTGPELMHTNDCAAKSLGAQTQRIPEVFVPSQAVVTK